MCASAAFLFALAAAALIVGVHDAKVAGPNLDVTALAVLLIAVGLVVAVGAYQLAGLGGGGTGRTGCVRPADQLFIAFLVTALTGLVLFFSAIGGRAAQWPVVVVVALSLVAVGLGGVRFFRRDVDDHGPTHRRSDRAGVDRSCRGHGQFWYQNQYVPSRAGRAVALQSSLQLVGERRTHQVVRARVSYEDNGGRSVSVIGSTYTLTGSRVVRCRRSTTVARVAQYFQRRNLDPQRSRFMTDVLEQQPTTVLAVGKFVADGKRLETDVPSQRELIFLVPRGRYQLLRFRAQLFAIPASVRLSRRASPNSSSSPATALCTGSGTSMTTAG